MSIYTTGELIGSIVAVVIFVLAGFGGDIVEDIVDVLGFFIKTVSLVGCVIMTIALLINIFGPVFQKRDEVITYQETLYEQSTLQEAINSTDDIINTELYTKAIDFNKHLAKVQTAQNDSKYARSFSGKVDWSTVPFVVIE